MINDAQTANTLMGFGRLDQLKEHVSNTEFAVNSHVSKLSDLEKRMETYEKSGFFAKVKRNVSVKSDFYSYIKNTKKELTLEFSRLVEQSEQCETALKNYLLEMGNENNKDPSFICSDGILDFLDFQDLNNKKRILADLNLLSVKINEILDSVKRKQNEMLAKTNSIVLIMRKNLHA